MKDCNKLVFVPDMFVDKASSLPFWTENLIALAPEIDVIKTFTAVIYEWL